MLPSGRGSRPGADVVADAVVVVVVVVPICRSLIFAARKRRDFRGKDDFITAAGAEEDEEEVSRLLERILGAENEQFRQPAAALRQTG